MTGDRARRTNRRMDELFPRDDPSECRVCTDPVVDGRWSYCSERCRRIARAVQEKFTWTSVRETVLERDNHTCQSCGLSKEMAVRAHWQMHERVNERTEHLRDIGDGMDLWRDRRRDLYETYGCDEYPKFEVDHIEPISEGGHPLDETNLQTLCRPCHAEKTAGGSPRPEVSLEAYMGGGE